MLRFEFDPPALHQSCRNRIKSWDNRHGDAILSQERVHITKKRTRITHVFQYVRKYNKIKTLFGCGHVRNLAADNLSAAAELIRSHCYGMSLNFDPSNGKAARRRPRQKITMAAPEFQQTADQGSPCI